MAHTDLESEVTRIERMVAHQRRAAAAKANPIAAMQQQQKEQQQREAAAAATGERDRLEFLILYNIFC